jgi:hypothetical protein
MAERRIDTSTAILLAGALIGVGVFFGLRSRPAEAPAAPTGPIAPPSTEGPSAAPRPTTAEAPPRAATPGDAATGPTAARGPSQTEIAKQAERAIDAHRAALVKKCWEPIKDKPSAAEVRFLVDVTFDADGKQKLRGIKQDKGTSGPDVTDCVMATLPPLRIQPPGVVTHADVQFRLP